MHNKKIPHGTAVVVVCVNQQILFLRLINNGTGGEPVYVQRNMDKFWEIL
jgi:hypothetical protein